MVRRDPHLFNLGTRGLEAHTFLCLEEGAKPHRAGVFGFHVEPKRSKVLQNQNSTLRPVTNHVGLRVLTRDQVLQNLSIFLF